MDATSDHKPNWLYFTGVFLGGTLIAFAIGFAVVAMFNIDPPSMMGLLVFAVAAHFAGKRYAASTAARWTRDERHRLAIGYSAIALVLSTLLSVPFLLFSALGGGDLPLADPMFLVILAVIAPVYAFAQYGIARWTFGTIMKRAAIDGAAQ